MNFHRNLRAILPILGLLVAFFTVYSCHPKHTYKEADNLKLWTIHPQSTVLRQQQQYVITGRNLYTAELIVGESVKIRKGKVGTDGKTMSFYVYVDTLKSKASMDQPGERIIQVRTLDAFEEFRIQIIDEEKSK